MLRTEHFTASFRDIFQRPSHHFEAHFCRRFKKKISPVLRMEAGLWSTQTVLDVDLDLRCLTLTGGAVLLGGGD